MEQLCYETLEKAGYTGYLLKNAPERVLQFGEGNFLRAFADYWFDMANEKAGWNGKCVLVQPIAQGLTQLINRQEGLYTLYLRGRQNGEKVDAKRVISSVSRCLNPYEKQDYDAMMDVAAGEALEYIVSNTTEAGIVYDPSCRLEDCPPASFPAKLTQVLLFPTSLPTMYIRMTKRVQQTVLKKHPVTTAVAQQILVKKPEPSSLIQFFLPAKL